MPRAIAQADPNTIIDPKTYQDMRWRQVGPHRGGRSTAVAGVRTQPNVFYMGASGGGVWKTENFGVTWAPAAEDRKSTRLNSSHSQISYAVFCLKKKKKKRQRT